MTATRPALRRATARYSGYMTLSIMLSYIAWRRSEFFFLAYYSTDTQIALYSIAFAATSALSALPERLSQVMVSAFATLPVTLTKVCFTLSSLFFLLFGYFKMFP